MAVVIHVLARDVFRSRRLCARAPEATRWVTGGVP